jgi:hypothetical protein
MTDSNAVQAYRRAIDRRGESVTFQRITGQAGQGAGVTVLPAGGGATVQAIVMNYQVQPDVMPVDPEGGVTLGDRQIIVLAADLLAAGFPLPLRKNDKAIVQGETLNIETLDPSKRGIAGAIEVHAKGSH